eukprot:TRINITY_DN24386_c0_g1_i2.p1 TRINITY_DN24386_c0_g1~~TRINITY_DN24386_c0_g1_i2.p1  ORF type:complete len:496 (-),score=64.63 TRINITY_DN24386_c0_g1_i2:269-1756(-)
MFNHSSKVFGSDHSLSEDASPDPAGVSFLVNAQIGTEQFVAAEMVEAMSELGLAADVAARPWHLPGCVSCSPLDLCDEKALQEKLLTLRSAQNVIIYHHHFHLTDVKGVTKTASRKASARPDASALEPRNDGYDANPPSPAQHASETDKPKESKGDNELATWAAKQGADWAHVTGEDLYSHVKQLLVDKIFRISTLEPRADGSSPSFRASCTRSGTHAFRSDEIEREVGGALQEYFDIKADMKQFDVNIRIEIVGGWCILGTQCNAKDMSLRHKLEYLNRVTLKSNLAYIMLRAAGIQQGATVLDPFCGSGTVLLEAAEWLNGRFTGIGFDTNRRAATGATANAKAEGYENCCTFHCLDARAMRKVCEDESVDAVVCNVPWGVQTGNFVDLESLYEVVLRVGWHVLKPGGRMVLLVLRGLQMMAILRRLAGRWQPLCFQVVRTTNNLPCIAVVEKIGQDTARDALQRQLYDISQYVNLAPEMYKALHTDGTKPAD